MALRSKLHRTIIALPPMCKTNSETSSCGLRIFCRLDGLLLVLFRQEFIKYRGYGQISWAVKSTQNRSLVFRLVEFLERMPFPISCGGFVSLLHHDRSLA